MNILLKMSKTRMRNTIDIEFSSADENARPMVTGRTVDEESRDVWTQPPSPSLRNHNPNLWDRYYD